MHPPTHILVFALRGRLMGSEAAEVRVMDVQKSRTSIAQRCSICDYSHTPGLEEGLL